jgi:hypothetical protein
MMDFRCVCVGCKNFVTGQCVVDGDPDECDTRGRDEYAKQNKRKKINIFEEDENG